MLDTIQAAIFDMDGTMVDNMGVHKKAWRVFMERQDRQLSDEDFRRIAGKRNDEILPLLFERAFSSDEIEHYAGEKEAVYRELFAAELQPIPGLRETLETLRAYGIKLAIATSAPPANRAFVLDGLDLYSAFDAVLGEEDTRKGKHDPELFLKTAARLGVPPESCLVFEDSPAAIKGAKLAGMTAIGLLTVHAAADLAEADYRIRNFTEITFVRNSA